jgi:hypothetical protein
VKSANKFLLLLLLALVALAITETQSVPQTPQTTVIHQDAFYIIGIEARTNAAKEMSNQGIIPQQWQKIADAEDKGTLGYTRIYKADYELYQASSIEAPKLPSRTPRRRAVDVSVPFTVWLWRAARLL